MEHYELEEVFSGRAQPKLYFVIKAFPSTVTGAGIKEYALSFGLMNIGRAIARFPFIEISNANLRINPFGIDGNGRIGMPRIVGQPRVKYQGGADHVVHIHDTLLVDQFLFSPTDSIGLMDIRIACDRFTMKTFTISVDLKFMAASAKAAKYDYDADKLILVEE
jgi:hypothetical protein